MRVGGCENVRAIHISETDLAKAYTDYAKKRDADVVCAPQLPPEEYEALCLNRRCITTTRSSRLLLEVPEQPFAGEPFWVGMSFRFPITAQSVEARFILPEGMQIVSGQKDWRGPVQAQEDHVLWVQVQTNRTGDIYLGGWAGIPGSSAAVTPLNWGRYFKVSSASLLTPQPASERILPTPTTVIHE